MTLSRNMLIYFVGKIIPALSVLFIMSYGVKVLGEEGFGYYSLVFNTAGVVVTFLIGWLQQSMLRFNSNYTLSAQERNSNFLRLTVLFSLFAAIIVFGVMMFYFNMPVKESSVIALYTFLFSCITVYLSFCQSVFRSTEYVIIESAYYLLTVLGILAISGLLVYFKFFGFYMAWIISGGLVLGYVLVRKFSFIISSISFTVNREFFLAMFRFGFTISAWLFISGLFNIADRFIIEHYKGFESVGEYSVIYDFIYRVSSFACLPALLTIHPMVTKAWNDNDRQQAIEQLKKGLRLIGLLVVAELAGFMLLGNFIFHYFFHLTGENYMSLIIPLVISSLLWQAALLVHKPLELLLSQHQMIIAMLLSIGSNIVLNILLVPQYGYPVAAFTTLASTIIYIVYVFIKTPRGFWTNASR